MATRSTGFTGVSLVGSYDPHVLVVTRLVDEMLTKAVIRVRQHCSGRLDVKLPLQTPDHSRNRKSRQQNCVVSLTQVLGDLPMKILHSILNPLTCSRCRSPSVVALLVVLRLGDVRHNLVNTQAHPEQLLTIPLGELDDTARRIVACLKGSYSRVQSNTRIVLRAGEILDWSTIFNNAEIVLA